ncbi:MAG: MCE family protein [Chthoniobacterales bacterium]|nr:MCE family protein [Chthoniobacterales bacterium]
MARMVPGEKVVRTPAPTLSPRPRSCRRSPRVGRPTGGNYRLRYAPCPGGQSEQPCFACACLAAGGASRCRMARPADRIGFARGHTRKYSPTAVMKYLQESDPRFRHLGLKVGSFLTALVVLVVLMAAVLGWRQDLFQPVTIFRTSPGDAAGITAGMDVSVQGIRVGRVSRVELDDAGQPRVMLRVQKRAAQWLRSDAAAVLAGRGPLESPYIELSTGSKDLPALADGAELPFRREASIGELASALEEQLRPLIDAGTRMFGDLNRPDGDMHVALAELRTLTGSMLKEIPPALSDARQTAQTTREFVAELAAEESDVNKARENLLLVSGKIEKELPALLDQAEETLAALRQATLRVDKSVQTSAPELEKLVRRSNDVALKADGLITDLRKAWLMKLFVPQGQKPRE